MPDDAPPPRSDRLRVPLAEILAVALMVEAMFVVVHVAGSIAIDRGIGGIARDEGFSLFDLDAEVGIPTWWQATILVVGALIAYIAGRVGAESASRWYLVALVFLAVSIDDASEIHERLTEPMRDALDIDSGVLFYAWVVPAMAVLVVLVGLLVPWWRSLSPGPRRWFLIGAVLFVSGGIGFELAAGSLDADGDAATLGYGLLVAAEEGLEMVGATVCVYALASELRTRLDGRFLEIGVS